MHSQGLMPNDYAFSSVLSSCADLALLDQGSQFHCLALKLGCDMKICTGNALINMYSKCGQIVPARLVFNVMDHRDVTSWNSLIHGYAQHGEVDMALKAFSEMCSIGGEPNESTLLGILAACNHAGMVDEGVAFFRSAMAGRYGAFLTPSHYACAVDMLGCTGNALINMYSKCGQIVPARLVFNVMDHRDVTSWNSLIHGYAQHGEVDMALKAFSEMCSIGGEPNESTLLGILAACNHAGMVDEGVAFFRSAMAGRYGAFLTPSHYACAVDMLGRSGRFDDALCLIEEMPFEPDVLVWKTMLASCRLHGNLETGRLAAEKLVGLSGQDSASYVLMSGIHAMHGEWRDADMVRRRMDEAGVKKEAGISWVEVRNEVHAFVAQDASHPDSPSIYRMLWELSNAMR
uniref:Pentatricopeptide repeat-containing protein n=1 Tax=Triticum urartu TaxID=4572 RepID=A0A8R7VIK8_TRIUA